MIMIPSNIAYFVLGFVSCLILLLIISYTLYKKAERKKEEVNKQIRSILISALESDNKQEEDK